MANFKCNFDLFCGVSQPKFGPHYLQTPGLNKRSILNNFHGDFPKFKLFGYHSI